MKTSIHYVMVYGSSSLMPKEVRGAGMMAWHLVRIITDDDYGGLEISREYVAIFNFDTEAVTFQRFLCGEGLVEPSQEIFQAYTERRNREALKR
jgi:hypothetical protein